MYALCFSVLVVTPVTPAMAGGGGLPAGATEITQIMNNAELMAVVHLSNNQLFQQIQILQNALRQAQLGLSFAGDITSSLQQVMNIYNQYQGLLHRMANLDDAFYVFSEGSASDWIENFAERYHTFSQEMAEYAERTLEDLGIFAENIRDGARVLEQLVRKADTADGQNQLLQAGNGFLAYIGQQLLEIQAILSKQLESYIIYAERERALQDAAAAVIRDDIQNWRPTYEPSYNLGDRWNELRRQRR